MKKAKELKEEFKKVREQELKDFNEELGEWLKEREIDLSANVISGEQGNQVQVFIVDKI